MQRGDQPGFGADSVGYPAARRQRMAAPGFGEAAQQHLLLGPGENQVDAHVGDGTQAVAQFEHALRCEAARAGIHAERHLARAAIVNAAHQAFDQVERRVVGGFVADILQRAQDRGAAGAGQAGDQGDAAFFGGRDTRLVIAHASSSATKAPACWVRTP